MARVSSMAIRAVATLGELLEANSTPTVRLGAAKSVLDIGLRLRAEWELGDRIAAIEAHLGLSERS